MSLARWILRLFVPCEHKWGKAYYDPEFVSLIHPPKFKRCKLCGATVPVRARKTK